MNSAIVLLAAQALASVTPAVPPAEAPRGPRVTALATVEILPSGTTRDGADARALVRHRLVGEDRRVTLEFE